MMRRRGVWTTNLVGLLVGYGMFSSFIMIPQFVQTSSAAGYGFGASVTEAGLFMVPSTIVMLFAGPLSGWMGGRYGSRIPLLLGTIISATAFGWLALEHAHEWQFIVGTTETGVATGMNTIMRTIGGSIGAQLAASIVTGSLIAGTNIPEEAGYQEAFAISAIVLVIAAIIATGVPRSGRSRPEPTSVPSDAVPVRA